MRLYSIGVACFAAIAVAAGMLADTASAAAPEFGRCVAKRGGKYATSGCTTEVGGQNRFEWEPGPGPKNKFTTAIKPATTVKTETVGKQVITCTGETSGGEIKNAKEVANVVLKFTGCTALGQKCESAGAAEGEIVTNPLGGPLGIEKKGREPKLDKIGEDLEGPANAKGEHIAAEFSCAGVPIVVRGSLIHNVVGTDKMVTTRIEKFICSKGKQKPEKFEGEPKDVLEQSLAGGPFEQWGISVTLNLTYEEKIEANSVV